MKTFAKVALLLGLMILLLLAAPALASHLCGGLLGGIAALGAVVFAGGLVLALAIVGGGVALVVGLALLLALACVVVTALLPVALPVLIFIGLVALIIKPTRHNTPRIGAA